MRNKDHEDEDEDDDEEDADAEEDCSLSKLIIICAWRLKAIAR